MRLGVMGGTFDPIHVGHLIAGSEALHRFSLDRVIFVPAGRPWQKSQYSDPEDRFMMTTLAAAKHPAFAVSRIELDRRGPTFTADTMEALRAFHGEDVELFFILGADAANKLGSWERLGDLAALTEMIAVARPGAEVLAFERDEAWPRVHVMDMPPIGVSSTDIRERVRDGRPIDFLVPKDVASYIRMRGLYVGSAGEAA